MAYRSIASAPLHHGVIPDVAPGRPVRVHAAEANLKDLVFRGSQENPRSSRSAWILGRFGLSQETNWVTDICIHLLL